MMTMYKGKRRNHRCKFAAPFHGSGAASAPASSRLSCADSQLDSVPFTRKRVFPANRRRRSANFGSNLSGGFQGATAEPLIGGRVTCCTRADWHRAARSPDPPGSLRSGRNAFAENLPTHQGFARLPREVGWAHLHATFTRTDLNQRKRPMRRRCGLIDQEMSGTIPVIGSESIRLL